VNGRLTIGGADYDWLSQPFKVNTATKTPAGSIGWYTQNPYGRSVELNLFSVPASEIDVNKLVGRIGGYDGRSEVFSPVVSLRSPAGGDLYRITALLSRYPEEEQKVPEEIPVSGTGHAIRVHYSGGDDFVYAGDGISSFDQFTTDAAVVMVHTNATVTEATLIGGSYLDAGNDSWISLSKYEDYFTAMKKGQVVDYRASDDKALEKTLFAAGRAGSHPVTADAVKAGRAGASQGSGTPGASGVAGGKYSAATDPVQKNTGFFGAINNSLHTIAGWIRSVTGIWKNK
jgi:hypothetical protein